MNNINKSEKLLASLLERPKKWNNAICSYIMHTDKNYVSTLSRSDKLLLSLSLSLSLDPFSFP